jgi:hypothetical protein
MSPETAEELARLTEPPETRPLVHFDLAVEIARAVLKIMGRKETEKDGNA